MTCSKLEVVKPGFGHQLAGSRIYTPTVNILKAGATSDLLSTERKTEHTVGITRDGLLAQAGAC